MKKIVLKNVVLLFCLLVVSLTSCKGYTDNNEYRADIEIINRTDSFKYLDIHTKYEGNSSQEADYLTDVELTENSSTQVEYRWIPGDFILPAFDAYDIDDAALTLLFEIYNENKLKIGEGILDLALIGDQTTSVAVSLIPVKPLYSDTEFNELLSQISDPLDKEAFSDLYISQSEGGEWKLSFHLHYKYRLDADTYITKLVLPIFKKNSIAPDYNVFLCSE